MSAVLVDAVTKETFAASERDFWSLCRGLSQRDTAGMTHGELEDLIDTDGREMLRQILQDRLDSDARNEQYVDDVADVDGIERSTVEAGHQRCLGSIFGGVNVERFAYRKRGHSNLSPADATLNLPKEKYSHGMRRIAATEATRGSFDDTVEAIGRVTGQKVPKRQVEELAVRAAADFDDFYKQQPTPAVAPDDVVVISCDGKGIVMLPDALRPATARAAKAADHKLRTRLSKGEKANRKRMATVGAVYTVTPKPRSAADIMASHAEAATPAPTAADKWLTASVVDDAGDVVRDVFDEAARRDPNGDRHWVALVDGNNHQIDRIAAEADQRSIAVTILCDFVHVLEYLWSAAWDFYPQGDRQAEQWVHEQANKILAGNARVVAAAIRRKATAQQLGATDQANAERCAVYLTNKAPYLNYPSALTGGWPIATGIIEGACRHLVKDRMDITGARWGLDGAEAVLQLRALRANKDLDTYWDYHLQQEHRRVHQSRYHNGVIPQAA